MLGFCPLASGSKGNCLYLGSKNTKVLIDAGISKKQIDSRLEQIGVSFSDIDAILVTHEHMDHIGAIKVLTEMCSIPIICNAETAKGIYQNLSVRPSFKIFTTGETFTFKDLEVTSFPVCHDTLDPVGFVIQTGKEKIGICTDLGFVSSHIISILQGCDYLYLEANHQPEMVHASNRPYVYKQRVLGRQGHLSNDECAKLIVSLAHPGLKKIFLAHLSSECNASQLAMEKAKKAIEASGVSAEVCIAYQEKISEPVLFN